MVRRGDVVIVDFPFTDVPSAKRRPAVVVQSDRYNPHIQKTIVAMITGNLRRTGDPCHVFVDPSTPEGASAGVSGPSLISCWNLYTLDQVRIQQSIGHLSDVLKQRVNDALKETLDVR